jgi:hypothetical protein
VSAALSAAVLALLLLDPSGASAAVAPDLSRSTLACSDTNGSVLLAGDDLTCSLAVAMAAGTESAEVSATVALPDAIDSAPLTPPATYNSATRVITFGPTVIGRMFASDRRKVQFHVTAATGLAVGTATSLVADVQAIGDIDHVEVHQSVTSNTLTISPPAADLVDSTLTCTDVDGGPLWPGDSVACDLAVVNALGHESAASVAANVSVLGATWLSGGASNGFGGAAFDSADLGDIAPGASKTVGAVFQVPPTALGGHTLSPGASVIGSSTPSLTPIRLSQTGAALIVSPGPAVLISSSLVCFDTDGVLLLDADDITCKVTVSPLAGYEGVDEATATIEIPEGAEYATGGDGHDANSVTLGSPSLGHADPGTAVSATFHLRVTGSPGTILRLTGALSATSVPFGGPVAHDLAATSLVVDEAPVFPAPPVIPAAPDGAPEPPSSAPPVVTATSGSYKLRAKTIRITLRRGHRRRGHLWKGSKRRSVFVKKFVVRTPKKSGTVVKKVTVPKKGKWAPRRGRVKIKGTRLTYTLKKGKRRTDRFHYTVTDTVGKKATGTVIVRWETKATLPRAPARRAPSPRRTPRPPSGRTATRRSGGAQPKPTRRRSRAGTAGP